LIQVFNQKTRRNRTMVMVVMTSRRPATIRRKPVVTLEIAFNDALVAIHTEVWLQVHPTTKHMHMFVVAGGASKRLDFGKLTCPTRVSKLRWAMLVLSHFGLVASHTGLVTHGLKPFMTRATGSFKQVMPDRGFSR
jgi:hypothetical protein